MKKLCRTIIEIERKYIIIRLLQMKKSDIFLKKRKYYTNITNLLGN